MKTFLSCIAELWKKKDKIKLKQEQLFSQLKKLKPLPY